MFGCSDLQTIKWLDIGIGCSLLDILSQKTLSNSSTLVAQVPPVVPAPTLFESKYLRLLLHRLADRNDEGIKPRTKHKRATRRPLVLCVFYRRLSEVSLDTFSRIDSATKLFNDIFSSIASKAAF